MTDNDIIKALGCCAFKNNCADCPQRGNKKCIDTVMKGVLELTVQQGAEIEHWQGGYMTQKQEIANLEIELKAMRGSANSYKAEVERLHNILLSFTNEVHTWSNKKGYDTTELSLIPILNEAESVREIIKANAVKEFAEMLKEKAYTPKPYGMAKVVDEYEIDNLVKEMVGDVK